MHTSMLVHTKQHLIIFYDHFTSTQNDMKPLDQSGVILMHMVDKFELVFTISHTVLNLCVPVWKEDLAHL